MFAVHFESWETLNKPKQPHPKILGRLRVTSQFNLVLTKLKLHQWLRCRLHQTPPHKYLHTLILYNLRTGQAKLSSLEMHCAPGLSVSPYVTADNSLYFCSCYTDCYPLKAMDGDSESASERILLEPYKYLLQLPGESFPCPEKQRYMMIKDKAYLIHQTKCLNLQKAVLSLQQRN